MIWNKDQIFLFILSQKIAEKVLEIVLDEYPELITRAIKEFVEDAEVQKEDH